ncbi:hypothetical protein CMI47_06100 [Candidatus Pacearchaeota archaeon]|nr:hypothetical protein [Candidatus Pacearchaeota archaeon]|tara:strand:+ start:1128 stop:1457 length:330 start_codon:yes stop_codon:yes gene_type:complete
MGFINKDTATVDAVLTIKGREHLRKAVYGENKNGEHVITKFALGDDEIDYSLWDMTPSGSNFVRPYGAVIDNQPMTEAIVTDNEIMNSFLVKRGAIYFADPEVPELHNK